MGDWTSARGARRASTALACCLQLAAASVARADTALQVRGNVTSYRLGAADREPGQWMANGRTNEGSFYSPLRQISAATVSKLGFAWQYKTGTFRGMEGTPLVVDGVMFVPGIWGFVYALDARSGQPLWVFDPKADGQYARWGGTDVPTRGLAVFRGKVYAIATDCRLFALDAGTGHVIWEADTLEAHVPGYACSGAPQIAGKVVVIGNVGGDTGKGGVRGYVSAFSLDTGRLVWRFFTVPSLADRDPTPDMLRAAATWDPHRDPSFGGGGTVWGLIAYDPKLDLVYFGTGNAAPYNVPRDWSGGSTTDRLYAASIIALNATTGRMRWYYQTTPGDIWDFDADANVVLANLKISGHERRVLLQANKNGYFYSIDRETGKPILAQPFAYLNWSTDMTADFRPVVSTDVNYDLGPRVIYPSEQGAHSWPPMSYSPATGLVYVPTIEMGNMLLDLRKAPNSRVHDIDEAFGIAYIFPEKGLSYDSLEWFFGPMPRFPLSTPDGQRPMVRSLLKAIDPTTGRIVWQQPTSQHYFVLDGGVLSTAGGLVFAGREDGKFVAYDAKTGRLLKQLETGSPIMAAPMTYQLDGRQYLAVLCGHGGTKWDFTATAAMKYINEGRVLVFTLDGAPEVPKPARREVEAYHEPPPREGTPEQIAAGKGLFYQWCSRCHTIGVPAMSPDLSRLRDGVASFDTFKTVILHGAFLPLGMPRFDDALSERDAAAIHAFLIDQAWDQFRREEESGPGIPGEH